MAAGESTDLAARVQVLERALQRERQARRQAEDLLESKATELYTANHELRGQYNYLTNVLSAIADGIVLVRADGTVRDTNPPMQRMLGRSAADLVGKPAVDLVELSTGSSLAEFMAEASPQFSQPDQVDHGYTEGTVVEDGGQSHSVSVAVRRVFDPEDGADGRVISVHDITHRILAEAQLRQLSNAIEQIADAVLITDREGRIEYANPAFETITGHALHEVIGERPSFLQSGYHDEAFYRDLWDTILAGKVYRAELVDRRKDGMEIHLEKTITPIRDPQGEITHFVSSDRDITRKRLVEKRLRESEERFRNLVEQAGDAFFVHDLKGQYVDVNGEACRSLGYGREELLQMSVKEVVEGADMERLRRQWEAMPEGQPVNLAGVHRCKDGRALSVESRIAKFRERDQVLVLALVRDVTERRSLEAQVVQAEKMAGLGQLAAGVAHEINNPVGYVMSNLQTLTEYMLTARGLMEQTQALRRLEAEAPSADGAHQRIAAEIERLSTEGDIEYILGDLDALLSESLEGAHRVRDIVQNLKSFARADDDVMQEANLNEGLEATLRVVWNELKYRIEVVKELGELPLVNCHAGQLNQVFMNLLVNASQAIATKGRIEIRTVAHGNEVRVRIADTGSGMSPHLLGRIFDPFFTTKEVGKGTGLGLSISHGIVQRHGGRIEVESEEGVGTAFTIVLPVNGPGHGD